MSQLVIRPGRNAAREAKRLKEIRHVKAAIRWHEQQRAEQKKLRIARFDQKRARHGRSQLRAQERKRIKVAQNNVKEDWLLGPLRPNRAVGEDADRYGTMGSDSTTFRSNDIVLHEAINQRREKKGLEPKYPLVFDKKKYFPIAIGDHVIITKGRSKNKIGVVENIDDNTDQLTIENGNKQYYPSHLFGPEAEVEGPKHISPSPLSLEHLRLVLPRYPGHSGQEGRGVVVDKIVMERHTTGIDPYTGTDYGDGKIPEEHQNDPQTGLPIFHRYIAGTRHRIPWPWEKEMAKKEQEQKTTKKEKNPQQSWASKTWGTIRHPITSLQRWRGQDPEKKPVQKKKKAKKAPVRPRSQPLDASEAHDLVDTTRNIVEAEHSMAYTLLAPPMPDTLSEELRDEIREMAAERKKEAEETGTLIKYPKTPAQEAQIERAARERQALERMKTPMQLRWETEQAKKLQTQQKQKETPVVDMQNLMIMLGEHMAKNNINPRQKRFASKAQEVE